MASNDACQLSGLINILIQFLLRNLVISPFNLPPQYLSFIIYHLSLRMLLQPKDLYEKLEFDKVIALLEKECSGEMGQVYFQNLLPETDLNSILKKLKEVKELKLCLENQ